MALLEAQLCDTINAYTKQFTMADPQTPETIRHRMNGRLDTFLTQTQDKLHDTLTACLRQNRTADQTADALAQTFAKAAASLSTDVETCYTKASWYKILRPCEQNGCTAFRFEVRLTDGTCGACSAQRGKTYTLGQLVEQDLLPPLHPNCCCMLLPETEQAGALPEIAESPAWYDPLLRIPSDALSMLNGFVAAQQERLGQGTVLGFLDWLTMGFVSGFAEGASNRFDALREQPSAYKFVNWLTLGAADMVKGAVNPDEPLSLEHWLNAIGIVSIAYGLYQSVKYVFAMQPATDSAAAAGATKTVWDDITATQPKMAGTGIPKSFELTVDGKRYWVNPNGTKHLAEYTTRILSHGQKMTEQQLLRSFQGAVSEAGKRGYQYNVPIQINEWELIFSPPRAPGQLSVIKHALYMP
ncbi:MAG: hypothetical protein Q4C72_09625 [Eubacteriales bacterium]|nr:hypothetical protein [Eubacteriales bacterium]